MERLFIGQSTNFIGHLCISRIAVNPSGRFRVTLQEQREFPFGMLQRPKVTRNRFIDQFLVQLCQLTTYPYWSIAQYIEHGLKGEPHSMRSFEENDRMVLFQFMGNPIL